MTNVQKLPACLEAAAKAFYLPVLSDVPDGCELILNNSRMHEPFLKMGEFAVVDKSDHEIRQGELYAVQQTRGSVIWQINLITDPAELRRCYRTDETIIWMCPTRNKDIHVAMDEADAARRPGTIPVLDVYLSDGPMRLSNFQPKVIGHVMGVFRLPKIVGMPS